VKRVLLQDLSEQLGLSKTLISMVINGKADRYGISKKTQDKVLEAIEKSNYFSSRFYRSGRGGKSYLIGLVIPHISTAFYVEIVKITEEIFFNKGYNLILCFTNGNEEKEKKAISLLIDKQGVDGIIMASSITDFTFYNQATYSDFPIVFMNNYNEAEDSLNSVIVFVENIAMRLNELIEIKQARQSTID
jgi:DNA-binding LacI/PurR family transcriptional regulator